MHKHVYLSIQVFNSFSFYAIREFLLHKQGICCQFYHFLICKDCSFWKTIVLVCLSLLAKANKFLQSIAIDGKILTFLCI